MESEQWILLTLWPKILTQQKCIQWLARRQLIANVVNCNGCQRAATLQKYRQRRDRFRWMRNKCNWTQSFKQDCWCSISLLSPQRFYHIPVHDNGKILRVILYFYKIYNWTVKLFFSINVFDPCRASSTSVRIECCTK